MAEALPILLGPCRSQLRQPAPISRVISASSLPVQDDATCMTDTQKDASEGCSTQPEGPPCSSPSSYSTCHLGTSCPGRVMTLAELCVGPSGTYMTVEGDCRVNVCEASQHSRRLEMAGQDASLREKVQCTRPDLNGGHPPPPRLPFSRAGPSRAVAECHHTRGPLWTCALHNIRYSDIKTRYSKLHARLLPRNGCPPLVPNPHSWKLIK